ncbi:MAG: TetR/AcrR family transcriptional regulator, partial [Planctomycetota bacterium]|nr:TetR/AcrR family transcriptional regulator [Planctomycetota bacterium]
MPPTSRQPQATRQRLIDAAFAEIHRHGLGPTGLDAILERAQLTKGAVYHHFGSKQELGLAVFDEVVAPWVRGAWIEPVRDAQDPLKELTTRVKGLVKRTAEERSLGCPLNNLIQELGGTEPPFQERINALLGEWRTQLALDLARGQVAEQVRRDLEPKDVAAF